MTRKQLNKQIGGLGEDAAEAFLRRNGLRILERNYRGHPGEIDIIAEEKGVLAFVEVKTRSPRANLAPATAVDDQKRQMILRTARNYLSRFKDPSPPRFDIVSVWVDEQDRVTNVLHEPNAFSM